MKRIRLAAGIILIVCAAAGLIFWEMKGREAVTTDQVLTAKTTIKAGEEVREDSFAVTGVPEKNKIRGALTAADVSKLTGKVASQTIIENDQISEDYFYREEFFLKPGESVFVIPQEWIAMRSSSLRRGDWVGIYSRDGKQKYGRYRVAFVKDSAEREVTDAGEIKKIQRLDRTDSTSEISHLEIISDLLGYQALLEQAVLSPEIPPFLIVQEGEEEKEKAIVGGDPVSEKSEK